MKGFQFFVVNLVFILCFAAFAFAQTEMTPTPTPFKIGLVETEAFYDKETGIREIVETNDKLEAELKPQKEELLLMSEKIVKLEKYLTGPPVPGRPTFEDREKEYKILAGDLKKRQEEVKTLYEKRKAEIFADVYKKVGDAIQQFAKEKGYTHILDASKLGDALIVCDDEAYITKEFIKYYNENYTKLKTQ